MVISHKLGVKLLLLFIKQRDQMPIMLGTWCLWKAF